MDCIPISKTFGGLTKFRPEILIFTQIHGRNRQPFPFQENENQHIIIKKVLTMECNTTLSKKVPESGEGHNQKTIHPILFSFY